MLSMLLCAVNFKFWFIFNILVLIISRSMFSSKTALSVDYTSPTFNTKVCVKTVINVQIK